MGARGGLIPLTLEMELLRTRVEYLFEEENVRKIERRIADKSGGKRRAAKWKEVIPRP